MDIRRVQMTGGSSFVLTLPKSWIESLGIKKNDPLGIVEEPNGTLLITKNISEEKIERIKTLKVNEATDPIYFFRILIGTYIAGFTSITIIAEKTIPSRLKVKIREFTSMVIGPEVIEESEKTILLKDLLNPLEMPFRNSLKRMFVLVKGMHKDSIRALLSEDHDLADDVMARDNDVDRLFWLISRQNNMIMTNIYLARKMETTISHVMPHYLISRILERVGDHAVRIARNSKRITRDETGEELLHMIEEAADSSLKLFEKSLESFFVNDSHMANITIESIHRLEEYYSEINREIRHKPTEIALPIRNISDSIRRFGEYSTDIAEIVINYSIMFEDNTS